MLTQEDLNFRAFIRTEGVGALTRAVMRAVEDAARHPRSVPPAQSGQPQFTPALDELFISYLPAALEKEQLELFFNVDGSKIKVPDLAEGLRSSDDHASGWLKAV